MKKFCDEKEHKNYERSWLVMFWFREEKYTRESSPGGGKIYFAYTCKTEKVMLRSVA